MTTMKRLGLAAVLAAAAVAFALPVPTASAWPEEVCKSYPEVPFMIDHKIFLVDGTNRAQCQTTVTYIRAEAALEKWMQRTLRYQELSRGERVEHNASWALASAFFNCSGMGPEPQFRTKGESQGLYGFGGNSVHSAVTSPRYLSCGEAIPLISGS